MEVPTSDQKVADTPAATCKNSTAVAVTAHISTESPKVSMLGSKSGINFVIPKNKLSGALVPVVRGGGKLEQNDVKDDARQLSRKTKWGTDLTQDPVVKRGRALALQTRAEQIAAQLESGSLEIDSNETTRSPSPPPIYDASGQRINTREGRRREQLDLERRDALGECMRLNPSFKPPSGYKPAYKEAKLFIPVREYPGYNFIGLILGPRGNTQKRMEAETGTKITIRGKGAVKEGKLQAVRRDGKELDGAFEDLHVHIMADSYDKVDAAVALIEPLLTPVDEGRNTHKWKQLRELAEMNGTVWEYTKGCSLCGEIGHWEWQCPKDKLTTFQAKVVCKICGDGGHPSIDCPLKMNGEGKVLDKEYLDFLEELGSGLSGTVFSAKGNVDTTVNHLASNQMSAGQNGPDATVLCVETNTNAYTAGKFVPRPMLLTASGPQPMPSGWTPTSTCEPSNSSFTASVENSNRIAGPPGFQHFTPRFGRPGRGGFNFFFPPFYHPGLTPLGGVAFFGGRFPFLGAPGNGLHRMMGLGPRGIFPSPRQMNRFAASLFGCDLRPQVFADFINQQMTSPLERPAQEEQGQQHEQGQEQGLSGLPPICSGEIETTPEFEGSQLAKPALNDEESQNTSFAQPSVSTAIPSPSTSSSGIPISASAVVSQVTPPVPSVISRGNVSSLPSFLPPVPSAVSVPSASSLPSSDIQSGLRLPNFMPSPTGHGQHFLVPPAPPNPFPPHISAAPSPAAPPRARGQDILLPIRSPSNAFCPPACTAPTSAAAFNFGFVPPGLRVPIFVHPRSARQDPLLSTRPTSDTFSPGPPIDGCSAVPTAAFPAASFTPPRATSDGHLVWATPSLNAFSVATGQDSLVCATQIPNVFNPVSRFVPSPPFPTSPLHAATFTPMAAVKGAFISGASNTRALVSVDTVGQSQPVPSVAHSVMADVTTATDSSFIRTPPVHGGLWTPGFTQATAGQGSLVNVFCRDEGNASMSATNAMPSPNLRGTAALPASPMWMNPLHQQARWLNASTQPPLPWDSNIRQRSIADSAPAKDNPSVIKAWGNALPPPPGPPIPAPMSPLPPPLPPAPPSFPQSPSSSFTQIPSTVPVPPSHASSFPRVPTMANLSTLQSTPSTLITQSGQVPFSAPNLSSTALNAPTLQLPPTVDMPLASSLSFAVSYSAPPMPGSDFANMHAPEIPLRPQSPAVLNSATSFTPVGSSCTSVTSVGSISVNTLGDSARPSLPDRGAESPRPIFGQFSHISQPSFSFPCQHAKNTQWRPPHMQAMPLPQQQFSSGSGVSMLHQAGSVHFSGAPQFSVQAQESMQGPMPALPSPSVLGKGGDQNYDPLMPTAAVTCTAQLQGDFQMNNLPNLGKISGISGDVSAPAYLVARSAAWAGAPTGFQGTSVMGPVGTTWSESNATADEADAEYEKLMASVGVT